MTNQPLAALGVTSDRHGDGRYPLALYMTSLYGTILWPYGRLTPPCTTKTQRYRSRSWIIFVIADILYAREHCKPLIRRDLCRIQLQWHHRRLCVPSLCSARSCKLYSRTSAILRPCRRLPTPCGARSHKWQARRSPTYNDCQRLAAQGVGSRVYEAHMREFIIAHTWALLSAPCDTRSWQVFML